MCPILKWWWDTDWFNLLRLNITLWDPSFLGRVSIIRWYHLAIFKWRSLIIPSWRNFSISSSMIVCSTSVNEECGLVALKRGSGSKSNSRWQWVTASKINGSDVIFSHIWRESSRPPALKGVWFAIIVATELWLTSSEDRSYWVLVDEDLGLWWDRAWPRPRTEKELVDLASFPLPGLWLKRPRPRMPLPPGTLYGFMRCLGVTLWLTLFDLVSSSTSLLRSSPNRKVDIVVDGLHSEAYCLFRSGRMRSLRFRLRSLFADNKRTAVWVRAFFCSPLELLHIWRTA